MLNTHLVPTMSLVSEAFVPGFDILDDSPSFRDEKAARLSVSASVQPSRFYTPDSAYHSGARGHDASASTTIAEADLDVSLSPQPAMPTTVSEIEDQPRPRHINDVIREKLDRARTRAARSTPKSTSASNAAAPTPRDRFPPYRQEEDGGVRLAGGNLGERGVDATHRMPAGAPQEDVWSIRRPSMATLPPPYEER